MSEKSDAILTIEVENRLSKRAAQNNNIKLCIYKATRGLEFTCKDRLQDMLQIESGIFYFKLNKRFYTSRTRFIYMNI